MLRRWQRPIGITVYFIIMTIIMTWPLTRNMSHSIVGRIGDNIYFVWLIQWFQKALFELHKSPLFVPFLNYPQGWYLAYTDITPAMVFIGLPAGMIRGSIFGYNFAILASFVLSGLGMYLWVYKITKNNAASLIAGTAFAFLPFRMAHFLNGHLSLVGTQWFPFYFWGLTDLIFQKHFSWKPILLASISLGLIGLTSIYYLYMTILVSVAFIIGALILINRNLIRDILFWRRLLLFVLASVPLLAIGIFPYLQVYQQGGMPDRPINYVSLYSASPTDFALPPTQHFLVGQWVKYHFGRTMGESTLYIGIIIGGLALLAFICQKKIPQRGLINLLVWCGFFAFILALGTNLHWLGHSVDRVPEFIKRWISQPDATIPLPGYFLFKFLPFYAKMRVWMRFGIFVFVFADALAGIGIAWLLTRIASRWRMVLAIGLLGLVIFDFFPAPLREFFRIESRPIDTWLAQQSGNGAVVQFPFELAEDQEQVYYTLTYNKPFIGGFFNAFPPEQYLRIQPVLMNFPNQESIDLLKQLGAEYILIDSSYYSDFNKTRMTVESLGLHLLTAIDSEYVYGFP
jgi:hypothetical protein